MNEKEDASISRQEDVRIPWRARFKLKTHHAQLLLSHAYHTILVKRLLHVRRKSLYSHKEQAGGMQKSQMIFGNTCKPTEAADRPSRFSTQAFLEFQSKLEQAKDNVKAQTTQLEALAQIMARNDAEIDKLKRKREEMWLEQQVARRAGEDALTALERARLEEQERKLQEAQVQASLQQMGVFCMSYIWIKQSSCTDARAAVTSSSTRNSVY